MNATRMFAHALLLGMFVTVLCAAAPNAHAQNISAVGVSSTSLYDGQSAVGTVYLTAPTSAGCWVTLSGGYLVPTTDDTIGGRSGSPNSPRIAYFPTQVYVSPGQSAASFTIYTIAGRFRGWVNIYGHKNGTQRALIYMHP